MKQSESVKKEMLTAGYTIGNLRADGQYHRFKVGSSKGEPGYYKVVHSEFGWACTYGDFVSGQKFTSTSVGDNGPLSPEDKARFKKQLIVEAEKLNRKHDRGAMGASFFWDLGKKITSHKYLEDKNVKSYGLRFSTIGPYQHWLMIPGYNAAGDIRTINYIRADGEKRFETDSGKKGAFFEIPGDDVIIICEGYSTGATIREATGHTVIVSFDSSNLMPVAKSIREKYSQSEIIIAADNDRWKPESGNPGVDAATHAAIAIDAKIVIPEFKDATTKPTDFNDLKTQEGAEEVINQFAAAKAVDKSQALKIEVKKLLGLDPISREFKRGRLSEKYEVRKSIIDNYLGQLLKESENETADSLVADVRPDKDTVDGKALLNLISANLTKRVILPDGAADAISLWIAMTFCHKVFFVLPILGITSPAKQCGKTTLISVLQGFTNKGLPASNISPAAVFRTIEKYTPTLLMDEVDTFIKGNEEMRGIIDSGHTRAGAFVIRVEGENHEPAKFSTWAPKAMGMIGTLPDTIQDRSIVIQLQRKMPGTSILKTGLNFSEQSIGIRAKLKRWAMDNIDNIREVDVSVPSSGNDRADDNWYPLFAIAEVIGGDWPGKVRTSMSKLAKVGNAEAIGIKLLIDIKYIFETENRDRIFSKDLIISLKDLDESPWADWRKGKGLTTNGLAKFLKQFGIESKTIRIEEGRYKGYTLDSFHDAFNRYIPPTPSVTTGQTNDFNDLGEKQNVTSYSNVTDEKHGNQLNLLTCHGVTDEKGDIGGKEENSPCSECKALDKTTELCHGKTFFEGKSEPGIPCNEAIKNCSYT